MAALAIAAPAMRLHAEGNGGSYLHWSGEQARRIGEAARVAGRVGRALDLRGLHTDRAYNYKLRATWLSPEVIRATARLTQLTDRLTDAETDALVSEATSAGDIIVLVEIDPREGSGVIPRDWAAFLGPKGADAAAVRGTSRPELDKLKGLRGVYRRDYNYEQFWVVFPARREDGQPLFGPEDDGAELTVRILDKEGHVSFKVPR
ncbi:MAG: hypothetical protein U1E63_15365 [Burkholderiales bacterium]